MCDLGGRCLTLEGVNPGVRGIRDPLRGVILDRVIKIQQEIQQGTSLLTEVTRAHMGDGQALEQPPITFVRQLLALIIHPPLLDDPDFPSDVKARARALLAACPGGSFGSYSESPGIQLVREHVARHVSARDGGIACSPDHIMLCSGATDSIKYILKLLVHTENGRPPGVMIPIPQYPLYSDTLAELRLQQVEYYLDESRNWALDISELKRSISEARGKGCNPRAIVVINPGNPTGQVLTRRNIDEIIKFAHQERLFILADEVYQDNVYAEGSQFFSFKRVLTELGAPWSGLELASFMSCSKGYMGECGLRGGYTEVINLDPEVRAMLLKSQAMMCPTTLGQAAVGCLVNPPLPGEPSYLRFTQEKQDVLDSLKLQAGILSEALRSVQGISCNPVQGAMYAFPRIHLSHGAVEAAKVEGLHPDEFYAMRLLEETGICTAPGSAFGQLPGTFHIRMTILPQPEQLIRLLEKFREFHLKFIQKYA